MGCAFAQVKYGDNVMGVNKHYRAGPVLGRVWFEAEMVKNGSKKTHFALCLKPEKGYGKPSFSFFLLLFAPLFFIIIFSLAGSYS